MERQQHSDDPQQLDLLRVCRIGRAQGLKGEVTVRLYTDEPEYRFAPGAVLYTQDGAKAYVVERSRTFKGRWIVKFEDVDDRNASEALNGVELYGEADDPEELRDEDAWYLRDLIGLEARMAADNGFGAPAGLVVGKVVDVIDGAQSLLKIRLSDAYLASLAADPASSDDSSSSSSSPSPSPSSSPSSLSFKGVKDEPAPMGTISTSFTGVKDIPADSGPDADRVERTALVPFVEQLVPDIDLDEGYLTLDPPGGLIPGLS